MNLLMNSGHDGLVLWTGLHQDVLGICSGEPNESVGPTVKPCNPPGVDRPELLGLNAVSRVRVLVVDWLDHSTEVQLHILLHQARVEWAEVTLLVIHTAGREGDIAARISSEEFTY